MLEALVTPQAVLLDADRRAHACGAQEDLASAHAALDDEPASSALDFDDLDGKTGDVRWFLDDLRLC
jgi:hypothetical protein